jgi:hypothetical protein
MAEASLRALEYTKANVAAKGKLYSVDAKLVVRESTAPPASR